MNTKVAKIHYMSIAALYNIIHEFDNSVYKKANQFNFNSQNSPFIIIISANVREALENAPW